MVQNFANPQTLNRYSYCVNNPLNRTDPTGHVNVADDGSSGYVLVHPTRTGFIVRLFDIIMHPKDWVIEQGINTITGPAGPKVDIVPSVVDKNDIPESQQAAYNLGQTMADVTVQTGIAVGIGFSDTPCLSLEDSITNNVVKGTDGQVSGFTNHGLESAINHSGHGMTDEGIIDTINNPIKDIETIYKPLNPEGTRLSFKYVGNNGVVVLNINQQVVTCWPQSSVLWRYP